MPDPRPGFDEAVKCALERLDQTPWSTISMSRVISLIEWAYPIIKAAVLQEAADDLRLERLTQTSHCNLSSAYCIGSGTCRGCDPEPSAEKLAELQVTPGIGDYLDAEAWLKDRANNA